MGDFSVYGGGSEILPYGASETTTRGVPVTADATPNTEGAWSEIVASTAEEINGFDLLLTTEAVGGQPNVLLELGVGGSGNEEVIFENFLFSISVNMDSDFFKSLFAGLKISKGSRVSARIRSSTASVVINVMLSAVPPAFTSVNYRSEIVGYGFNTADSGGTSVDPGSSANTKGSWEELTSSTNEDIHGIAIAIATINNTASRVAKCMYDISIGTAGNENDAIIALNVQFIMSQQEVTFCDSSFKPVTIPAGSRISVRFQSSTTDATDRVQDFAIYGLI